MDKQKLAEILNVDDEKTIMKFWEYHKAHPDIFDAFKKISFQVAQRGFTNYQANTVMGVVRYEAEIRKGPGEKFKINNNYIPYYASLFMWYYPGYKLYTTRVRKGFGNGKKKGFI